MTATTSKLGADMLKDLEEIRSTLKNASCMSDYGDAVEMLSDLIDTLASQPAAIDKQCTCKGVLGHSRQCAIFDESMMSIAAPLANEASKPAPSVEQGERAACDRYQVLNEAGEALLAANHGEAYEVIYRMMKDARAASTSANVAQGWQMVPIEPTEAMCEAYLNPSMSSWRQRYAAMLAASPVAPSANVAQYRNEALSALLVDHSHAASAKDVDAVLKARDAIYSMFANVAQGAEAVATVKVYETYTGQNGWTEVTQEEYDRTKDKYEHRIRRVPAPPAQPAITDAARDVLDERQRQVTAERWTPEHDDAHEIGELARAAACYAANATGYRLQSRIDIWPWNREWWKPTAPRRDLVKAGALILAEIERLDRRALTAAQPASEGNHAG